MLRRFRLPARTEGRADSDRGENIRGGRYAGRDDLRPAVSQGAADIRGARGNSEIFRQTVRSARGRGVHGAAGEALARTARQDWRSLPADATADRLRFLSA